MYKKDNTKSLPSNKLPNQKQIDKLLFYFNKSQFENATEIALKFTKKFAKHQLSWKILDIIYSHNNQKI